MSLFSDKTYVFNDETIYIGDEWKIQISKGMDFLHKLTQKEIFEQYRNMLMDWIPSGASIAIAVEDTFVYFASGHQIFL